MKLRTLDVPCGAKGREMFESLLSFEDFVLA
jgi:hypothetical protein